MEPGGAQGRHHRGRRDTGRPWDHLELQSYCAPQDSASRRLGRKVVCTRDHRRCFQSPSGQNPLPCRLNKIQPLTFSVNKFQCLGNFSPLGKDGEDNAVSGWSQQLLDPRTSWEPDLQAGRTWVSRRAGTVHPPTKEAVSECGNHPWRSAQNAASNSPCPTVAPTFQRLTAGSNLFATGSSPKSAKHVVMSPLHSQHACQLMDDHPKEAKDAYLRRESQARNQGQGESELTGIKRFANSKCRQNALGVTPLGEHSPCPERWGIRRAKQRALKRQLQQPPEC